MENLKDWIYLFYDLLKPILIIIIGVLLVGSLINIMFYYAIKIDESNLENIRFCPSCGVDLIYSK